MKKFMLLIIVLCLIFTVAACGNIPHGDPDGVGDPAYEDAVDNTAEKDGQPDITGADDEGPDEDKNEEPVDSEDDPSFYEGFDDTIFVSEQEADRIYCIYNDMADRYTIEKVKGVEGKDIDTAELWQSRDKSRTVAARNAARAMGTDGGIDIQKSFIDIFYTLKDVLKTEFSKYCKKYYPLKLNGQKYYVRIQTNQELQELELCVKTGSSYFFFTNFYLDPDCNRHLDYSDGYIYCVELNKVSYNVVDKKVTFPINYEYNLYYEDNGLLVDGSNISNEVEFDDHDIVKTYSLLKYPFLKMLFSTELKPLIGTYDDVFSMQEEFRCGVDRSLYDEAIVGQFDFNGLNFDVLSSIEFDISDEKITISTNEFIIYTLNKRLFSLPNVEVMLFLDYHITERAPAAEIYPDADENDVFIKERREYRYYKIVDNKEFTGTEVIYTLKEEILLSESIFVSPAEQSLDKKEYVINCPDREYLTYEEESIGGGVIMGCIRSDGSVVSITLG